MNNPPAHREIPIGELAERTGLAVSAIRYYEQVGLIAPAARRPSGHRIYQEPVQHVLTLIRHCRDFGFSIESTKALVVLSTSDTSDCVEARDIAQVHLSAIQAKLAELRNMERSLSKFVQACSTGCVGGPAPKCTILKDLSNGKPSSPEASGCCG